MQLEFDIIDIYLASAAGDKPTAVKSAELSPDGLVGDRYEQGRGTFSNSNLTDGRALTIIDEADLLWLKTEHGLDLLQGQHRRNLVTRGLDLLAMVHQTFRLGTALVRGNRPCPPCGRLSNLLGIDAKELLKGRGGLRCDVIEVGQLKQRAAIR